MHTEGRDDAASRGLLQWNLGRMAFALSPSAIPVDPMPDIGWQVRPIRERGSELDGALRLLVNLGSDRPENPQLLLRSTARWLRSDQVADATVDVFEGPGKGTRRTPGRTTGSTRTANSATGSQARQPGGTRRLRLHRLGAAGGGHRTAGERLIRIAFSTFGTERRG